MDHGYGTAQAASNLGAGMPVDRPNGQIKQSALEVRAVHERIFRKLETILMRVQGPVPSKGEQAGQIEPDHITFIMQENLAGADRIEVMVGELENYI